MSLSDLFSGFVVDKQNEDTQHFKHKYVEYTYFKGNKINLVKFNFVEKGGSTGKSGVQTSSACDRIV